MSEEYATTRQDFLTATASYLGLDTEAIGNESEVKTDGDVLVAVLHVWLKPSDIIGIGKRMQEIAAQNNHIVQVCMDDEPKNDPPFTDHLREEYNRLSAAEKGKHGSFGKYVTWRMMNDKPSNPVPMPSPDRSTEGRKVTHVDAPEEPEPTNMDAVWLWADQATDAQKQYPVDYDAIGRRYLVQWAMLTDEQKQQAGKP